MERLSKNDVLILASTSGDASLSDLSGLNLRGVELLGMRFDGSNLQGTDQARFITLGRNGEYQRKGASIS